MPSFKTSSRARTVLEHQRSRGRAYPTPRYWEKLYQMLEEEAEKRGKTPPPAPLLHGGLDSEPTEDEKMERLDEQTAWADRNYLLHRVQMFFDTMPSSAWTRKDR
jgi:hypothetical protein